MFASYLSLQSYNVVKLGFKPGTRDHALNHGMYCLSYAVYSP